MSPFLLVKSRFVLVKPSIFVIETAMFIGYSFIVYHLCRKNLHFCWLTLPFLFMFHLGPGLGSQEGFSLGTTAARIALRGSPAKGIGNIETAKGNVKSWAISIYIPSDCRILIWLVVWNIFYFSIQLGIIIPTDEVHHFSEGLKPPTSLWSIEISIHQSS